MMIERIRTAVSPTNRRVQSYDSSVIEANESLTTNPDGKRRRDPNQERENEPPNKLPVPPRTNSESSTQVTSEPAHIDVIV